MDAREKIKTELAAAIVMPIGRIAEYIDSQLDTNDALASAVALETKTLKQCYEYIVAKAKEEAPKGSSSACYDDATVYAWAIEYYMKPEEEKKPKEEEKSKEEEKPKAKRAKAKKEPEQIKMPDPIIEADDDDFLA